eukprot:jgi/Astpho2/1144/Aster-07690
MWGASRAFLELLSGCNAGSINTIATKFQDLTVTGETTSGEKITFNHPAVQSSFMFLGEFMCLVPYFILRWRKQLRKKRERAAMPAAVHRLGGQDFAKRKPYTHTWKTACAFALPAVCDAAATTLLNLGLYYTDASVFQMLRGTLVLWAGLLTVVILKRRLHIHHCIIYDMRLSLKKDEQLSNNLLTALMGKRPAAVPGAKNPVLGDILVVIAQVAAALQFIIEEKYLAQYRVPALFGVGLEGFWGLLISCAALPILALVTGPNGMPLDSLPAALREIRASRQLQVTTIGSIVSIAFFNFFGLSVTKSLSGAARATIDASRTLLIWLFSIQIGWERFHFLQVLGFLVLVSGTSLYNELIRGCLPSSFSLPDPEEDALQPQSIGSMYGMARSMRLFPQMFSPHSLASPAAHGMGAQQMPSAEDLASSSTGRESLLPVSSPSPQQGILNDSSVHAQETIARQKSSEVDADV